MSEHYQPGILILAAGASRRFNGIKQLANVNEQPLLARCLRAVEKLPIQHKVCVLGANAEHIKMSISFDKGMRVTECPNWQAGLSASIAFGIRHLSHCSHALLVLADQPDIGEQQLKLLLHESIAAPEKIVCGFYCKRNGAPAIFPQRFFPMLSTLQGDRGAGQVLNHPAQLSNIKTILLNEACVDIDTPEDLANWQNKQ